MAIGKKFSLSRPKVKLSLIKNCRADFDSKMNRLVDVVVRRIGIDVGDRFSANARKVKFVINGLPEDSEFPVKFTDFQVNLNVLHSF